MAVLKSSNSSVGSLESKPSSSSYFNSNLTEEVVVFTANGTWIKPKWAKIIEVTLIGGGGGGASGSTGAAAARGGTGGSGSGLAVGYFLASSLPPTVDITVGDGGLGGNSITLASTSGENGFDGDDTVFGTYFQCPGGLKGAGSGFVSSVAWNRPSGTNGKMSFPISSDALGTNTNTVSSPIAKRTLALSTVSTVAFITMDGNQGLSIINTTTAQQFTVGTGIQLEAFSSTLFYTSIFNNIVFSALGGTSSITANGENGFEPLSNNFGFGGGGGAGALNGFSSGAGGKGAKGLAIIKSYSNGDLQQFDASGTWTKPVGNYSQIIALVIGAGGGGGSGRRGAANSLRLGGGGGGSGAIAFNRYNYDTFTTSTQTITIGLGGTGGNANTGTSANGNAGQAGGSSIFGDLLRANGGAGGAGGVSSGSPASAAGGTVGLNTLAGFAGSIGGAARNQIDSNGGPSQESMRWGSVSWNPHHFTSGGISGVGISTTNTVFDGTFGNNSGNTYSLITATGGTVGSIDGQNATDLGVTGFFFGRSGGSGRSGHNEAAGTGGDSIVGAGGAGGSAGTNTFTVPKGGKGGDGRAWIICL